MEILRAASSWIAARRRRKLMVCMAGKGGKGVDERGEERGAGKMETLNDFLCVFFSCGGEQGVREGMRIGCGCGQGRRSKARSKRGREV